MSAKRILYLVIALVLPGILMAQVTTGSITGIIKTPEGKIAEGATVKAVHEPTGSAYATLSKSNGEYILPNLRVGGPYTVTFNYVGMTTKTVTDVNVSLGTPSVLNIAFEPAGGDLQEVTVTATTKGGVISSLRNGTSTFISQRQINSVPTINRNVQDFARLTPQVKVGNNNSNGAGAGISFGGQNNRYNQFTIDGANATDGFGLGSTGSNGGQANVNPISMEAIQEIQIVMSPYDVTQGGFTGGGINAVTKSGTNAFHGSVYGQYQNQTYIGKSTKYNDGVTRNKYGDFKNQTFGASLGGPIIKNKLFFFASVEHFEKSTPLAYDPTQAGSGSKVSTAAMDSIRNYLMSTYNYDPGTYGAISNNNKSTSVFGRIDWNINDKNKLAVRFNHVDGTLDVLSRTATAAIFSNSGYGFSDKNTSFVAELNSNFSSKASNVLRVTYTKVKDARTTSAFPSITLNNYNTATAASIVYNIGSEGSSAVNGLEQNSYSLTDNFTLYKGKHTLTFGTDNMLYKSDNLFLQYFNGQYTYGASGTNAGNVANFVNGVAPTNYSIGFSTSADKNDKAPATLKAAQLSLYGQDVWSLRPNFKLTYGIRADLPVFFKKPAENTAFNTAFADKGVATNQMPKSTPLFSPRAGFNWDVKGDATTQLRGGAGLFTGRIPFVWVSNQMSNTGVASQTVTYAAAAIATNGITFNYDPSAPHMGAYVPAATATSGAVINVIDKKFKFPQVFRANLAVDQKLPFFGLIGTLEGVYTKTLNNATYENLNISADGDATVKIGSTTRPFWNQYTNTAYGNVLLLTNTSKGYGYNVTAQIQKPYAKGWSGSIAYTYGHSTSLNDLTSSVAQSNWRSPLVTNGLNKPDVATSNFNMGSRIVGFLSKEFKYGGGHFATSFTLIYTGQSGQRFSYVYANNILGDYSIGSSTGAVALAYIPATAAEANLVDITGGKTASAQWADYQTFVNDNKYLKDNQGKNSERNGAHLPFENHFDFRIAQDFVFAKKKLQVFVDIINVGNMLNKDWGWAYYAGGNDGFFTSSTNLFSVVTSGAQTKDGVAVTDITKNTPGFQFNVNNFTDIKGTRRAYSISDFTSRWNSQAGLRFTF